MESKQRRKEALREYKERKVIGGLYKIVNTQTGDAFPLSMTANLQGIQNRFTLAKTSPMAFNLSMSAAFAQYGMDAFELQVVETLEKKPEHSDEEFHEELAALLALHTGEDDAAK